MSLKRYCLVPPTWTPDEYARHSCDDRSHLHLSHSQVYALEIDGLVEWLHQPLNRRDRGIVRLCRLIPVRGLSCRVGAELAEALHRGLVWARVMLAEIDLVSTDRMIE